MPYFMPYDHAHWVANVQLIQEGSPAVIKEALESLCPGKKWGERTKDLLGSRDSAHSRKLLFTRVAANEWFFERGDLWWQISEIEAEEENDEVEREDQPVDRPKLLEASRVFQKVCQS